MPRDGTAALRRGEKPFPSEQRLAELDVHTAGLPKALMADLVRTVGNRTILFMGDSVMEQVGVVGLGVGLGVGVGVGVG